MKNSNTLVGADRGIRGVCDDICGRKGTCSRSLNFESFINIVIQKVQISTAFRNGKSLWLK